MDTVVPSYPSIDMSYAFDNSNASSIVSRIALPSSLSAEATAYSLPSPSVTLICAAGSLPLSGARESSTWISLLVVSEKYASAITGL